MDNIENNILKIINENNEVIEEVSLKEVGDFISGVTSSGTNIISDYTKNKIEGFFNNKIVESILTKMVTKLIINNPQILKEVTNNVLDNIKINVEKK